MDWGSYFLGIASAIFLLIVSNILNPTLAELGIKLHAKVWKKPLIRGQLKDELKTLELIQEPLLKLNQIPQYPDSCKDTQKWLLEIDTKARQLKKKEFQDIRKKLIEFASPMEKININTSLKEILKLFVRDKKAFTLVEEIREIVSNIITKKTKKNRRKEDR